MKIAIKNPAPLGPSLERWGDFHFGVSLESALRRLGIEVVQHYWPDWKRHDGESAAIWLRGKRRAIPRAGVVNAIWILSHPATVTPSELAGFDVVFAGSERLASHLEDQNVRNVALLRQCTDSQMFKSSPAVTDDHRQGLLFLASSRGVRRPILDWALEAGFKPTLIGHGWRQVGHGSMVSAGYLPNTLLPELYTSARYGMNDHWGDMAYYQIINNRIFDCMASGLPVISDGFAELAKVADGGVWIADGPSSFRDAYWSIRLDYAEARKASKQRWDTISSQYTFDSRAREIVRHLISASAGTRHPSEPVTGRPRLEPVVVELLRRVRGPKADVGSRTTSMLHVFPAQDTSGALAAIPTVSVLSAGIGVGPWNMRLDLAPGVLGDRRFDLIFVEASMRTPSDACVQEVVPGLVALLKPGGIIGAGKPRTLSRLQSDPRFTMVCDAPAIYRRAGA